MARSSPQPRVPPGVPSGGQWAAVSQPRLSDGILSSDGLLVDPYDDPLAFVPDDGAGIDSHDLYDQAVKSGRHWGRRYRVDPDEVTSETLEAYLRATGGRSRVPANPSGYLHTVARHFAAAMATGAQRSEDRAAMSAYREAIASLGREPTSEEEDRIAEEIRMAQPARRRATQGFHRRKALVRLSDLDPSDLDASYVADSADISDDTSTDTNGDDRFPDVESLSQAETIRLRRQAWTMVAPNAPQPCQASLGVDRAARARATIFAGGGLNSVVNRWYDGDATDEETDALFSPFGDLDHTQRADVARVLRSHPGAAAPLWDSTVTVATRRGSRSKPAPQTLTQEVA